MATPAFAQDYDNRTMGGRLERMERDLQLLQRQIVRGEPVYDDGDMSPTTAARAGSSEARLGALEEQIRSLRGQLEQSEFKNKQLEGKLELMQKDLDMRLGAIEHGVTPPAPPAAEEKPAYTTGDAQEGDGMVVGDKMQPLNKKKSLDEQAEAGAKFDNPRDHYNYAFKLLRQAKHAEAGDAFGTFIADYPKDPLVGNAYYWLGETYYVRRDYVKAADSFRQGFEVMPAGPKAADNLLKLAMSLSATKEDAKACVVLKQLVKKFGENSAAVKQKAESEMNRLQCE
jgi:tol-pal system protein YbgF